MKAPAASAGKKARCPACGNVMVLKASGPAVAAAPRPAAVRAPLTQPAPAMVGADGGEDDGLGGLYELAEQAQSASAVTAAGPPCPGCGAAMEDDAVLCTNCGYDTRSGKALATQSVAASAKAPPIPHVSAKGKSKPVDLMAPDGSIVVGLALSAAFALAASVIWFLSAWLTGWVIGYIAALIGVAAGLGMRIGHKGYSAAGGWAAGAMTVAAILTAKLAVLEFVVMPHMNHHLASFLDLNAVALGYYFFRPISLIIIGVGVLAAYRTANASMR